MIVTNTNIAVAGIAFVLGFVISYLLDRCLLSKKPHVIYSENLSRRDVLADSRTSEERRLGTRRNYREESKGLVLFFPDEVYPCTTFYNFLFGKPYQECRKKTCTYRHRQQEWTSFMKLLQELNEAKKQVDICVYLFTQEILAELIIHLYNKRNIRVRIITDSTGDDEKKIMNQMENLKRSGIEVKTYKSTTGSLMHNKFVIIDNKKVIHGSLNWTKSAILQNHESIAITMEPGVVKDFVEHFRKMWREFNEWSKKETIIHIPSREGDS